MNNRGIALAAVIVAVVLAAALGIWYYNSASNGSPAPGGNATSTPAAPTGTPSGISSLTLAGGEVSLKYFNDIYALAASPAQVLVHPYIPPCDEKFDYCIYYNGNEYSGTNFESAGLRIVRRPDIGNERLCLDTPPAGFSSGAKPTATVSKDRYAAGTFASVGDAAAGHVAEGSLYRLFVRNSSSCYEFETRIGNSQFANYPSGTIREFTAAARQNLKASLAGILSTVMLVANGEQVAFP